MPEHLKVPTYHLKKRKNFVMTLKIVVFLPGSGSRSGLEKLPGSGSGLKKIRIRNTAGNYISGRFKARLYHGLKNSFQHHTYYYCRYLPIQARW
jgi:hypothetical protein